jgi:hypothetical protein
VDVVVWQRRGVWTVIRVDAPTKPIACESREVAIDVALGLADPAQVIHVYNENGDLEATLTAPSRRVH